MLTHSFATLTPGPQACLPVVAAAKGGGLYSLVDYAHIISKQNEINLKVCQPYGLQAFGKAKRDGAAAKEPVGERSDTTGE